MTFAEWYFKLQRIHHCVNATYIVWQLIYDVIYMGRKINFFLKLGYRRNAGINVSMEYVIKYLQSCNLQGRQLSAERSRWSWQYLLVVPISYMYRTVTWKGLLDWWACYMAIFSIYLVMKGKRLARNKCIPVGCVYSDIPETTTESNIAV